MGGESNAQPETAVAGLERRLLALEDERRILDLLHAYGHSIDYGPEAEFVDCWTADAELAYTYEAVRAGGGVGREEMRFRGREEIAGFWRRHTHAPERYHKHLLAEPRIDLDGDSAGVASYFARLDVFSDGPAITSFGRYLDTVIRCPDGRWRFHARRGEIESLAQDPSHVF